MAHAIIPDQAIQANRAPVRGRLVRRIAANQQAIGGGWHFAPPNLQFPAGVPVTETGAAGQTLAIGQTHHITEFRPRILDMMIGAGGTRVRLGFVVRQAHSLANQAGTNTVEYALRYGGVDVDVHRVAREETDPSPLIKPLQFQADIEAPTPDAIHELQLVARLVAGSAGLVRVDWTDFLFQVEGGVFTGLRIDLGLTNAVEPIP